MNLETNLAALQTVYVMYADAQSKGPFCVSQTESKLLLKAAPLCHPFYLNPSMQQTWTYSILFLAAMWRTPDYFLVASLGIF